MKRRLRLEVLTPRPMVTNKTVVDPVNKDDSKVVCTKKDGGFSAAAAFCYKSCGGIGGDWIFLTLLGVLVSAIAFFVNFCIDICTKARSYIYRDLASHPSLQYFGWIWLPLCLILFSTSFTFLLAPQAAGSGIPEIKTILIGIIPKKSFTVKGLIVKIIGLAATLGTGLPLGKEGPFVHITSMTAVLLTKATYLFRGIYENKIRHKDMLAAACAVGVAMAFAAPIGGVLFSIEVTAVHFAVRNYWRGFFAALCATVLNRFIAVWFQDEATLTAIHFTTYFYDKPYLPAEIIIFAFIGVICGFFGAFFVWVHRKYVTFKNNNKMLRALSEKSVLIYPFIVTLLYTSLTFPLGFGMFVAGEITTSKQIDGIFANFSWTKANHSVKEYYVISHWMTPYTGIFINLCIYVIFTFLGTILASTIPAPAGIFVPVFKMGAAIGRMVGELTYLLSRNGAYHGNHIIPGGYAVVGAAALAGAVTHTVSCSVIVFELTGQMTFAIPVMVAVFIANGIAQVLQPSIFDSIIEMRKLPYLPNIPSTTTKAYDIYVEDFMVRNVKFIWYGITYGRLQKILWQNKKINTFPLVDSADSMILLGSANRRELISLIEEAIGPRKKAIKRKEWTEEAERFVAEILKSEDLKPYWTPKEVSGDLELPSVKLIDESRVSELPHRQYSSQSNVAKVDQSKEILNVAFDVISSTPIDEGEPVFNPERRPSRFSVTRVEGPAIKITTGENKMHKTEEEETQNESQNESQTPDSQLPRKGILKKTNSFSFDFTKSPTFSPKFPYYTMQLEDSKRKKIFSSLRRPKSLLRMDSRASHMSLTGISREDLPLILFANKLKELEVQFEERGKKKTVDFTHCQINPAPHQLVERSNLLQVHSVFSLLSLQHSYVTAIGRLIGVVGIKELREVIERVQSGEFDVRGKDTRKFSLGFLTIR